MDTTTTTTINKSPSMAYPPDYQALSLLSRCYSRQYGRVSIAVVCGLLFLLFMTSDYNEPEKCGGTTKRLRGSKSPNFGGAYYSGYFPIENSITNNGNSFHFAAVSDLDKLTRVEESKQPLFRSVMVTGIITYDSSSKTYNIKFDEETRNLVTKLNEGGRGAEFSELTVYQDRLFTFDDRTGGVFEILNDPLKSEDDGTVRMGSIVVPRFVMTEGNGYTAKGIKWEWATVKDDTQELYMGSMGKEFSNPDGSIDNANPLWIGILNSHGELHREDWSKRYNVVRNALGGQFPGYVLHEAVNWSEHLQKWVFFPRRISFEPYDEVKDERKGSNKVVLVDADFSPSSVQIVDVQLRDKNPLHGFSSAAFVPNTKDRHVLATRTVEENCNGPFEESECNQRSYFLVFDVLTGEVLLDEVRYEQDIKLEGVEFVNMHTKPPPH